MKIFAIGRNYAAHAKELNNPVPKEPVIFSKPPTALLKNNKPFYHPTFSNDIHYEVEIVLKIGKNGKKIAPKFAKNYIDQIGIGIDFTARDIQNKLKEAGKPWEIAKGFDSSAPISEFIPISEFQDLNNIEFSLKKNDTVVQQGNTKDLLFTFEEVIAYISTYFTLQKGDLIFTGTPEGVGPIKIGDKLEAFIENNKKLLVEIR
ncbi:MAG: acylpyruvate hydrolase [Sphingobacteriales bacterium]|jgi:acylpyruvate hydrolase